MPKKNKMQTRCPECNTLFKLTDHDLKQADGQVQCGHCFHVFTAEPETDVETLADDNFKLVEEVDTSDIDLNTFTDAIDDIPDEEPLSDDKPEQAPLFEQNPMIDDLVPPEIRHQQEKASKPYQAVFWSFLIILLSLSVLTQLVYFNRDQIASKPGLRPYMLSFCQLAQCGISELRDLKRLELSSKNVYSHPNVDNALMITAVIVNQAAFAQQFPVLQISFTNLVGDIVMARQFNPGEYLNTEEENLNEMQPGLPIQITLEVLDPGSSATAYEFNFI